MSRTILTNLVSHQSSDGPSSLLTNSLSHTPGRDLARLSHDDVDHLLLPGVLVQDVLRYLGTLPAPGGARQDANLVPCKYQKLDLRKSKEFFD